MIELNENDIKGKKYQALINSANHKCDSVSLVFERGEDGYIHESIFQMVACDLIKNVSISLHPNTGTDFSDSELLYFKCGNNSKSTLLKAFSISEWNGQNFPEEMCFYSGDIVWLKYISHEHMLFITEESEMDIEFLNVHKIAFHYTM